MGLQRTESSVDAMTRAQEPLSTVYGDDEILPCGDEVSASVSHKRLIAVVDGRRSVRQERMRARDKSKQASK